MLGRLEMDVSECIKEYKTLMRTVFDKKEGVIGAYLKGRLEPRFSSKVLEKVIKGLITRVEVPGRKPITVDDPFYVGRPYDDSRRCRVFVCAQREETGKIACLRSYYMKGGRPGEATIWQAALATSAATRFFAPVKIGDCTYVDGALGANNPAQQVEKEASRIWCEMSGTLYSQVKCLLSLGTGKGGINPVSDRAWKFVSETLKNVATDTETTAEDVAARWRNVEAKPYFRFNVEQGLDKIGLAECKDENIGLMEAATLDYLDREATRQSLSSCVKNLRTKVPQIGLEPNSAEHTTLRAARDRTPQQAPETMSRDDMIELRSKANALLEQSRSANAHKSLQTARSCFDKILRAQQRQQPPASPSELCYTYSKLRSTHHRLSHLNFSATERMEHIDRAAYYGDRAIKTAHDSRNDNRVSQMQFFRACVQAEKIHLRSVENQQFQPPTEAETRIAEEAIGVAWTTLRSVEGSDMGRYESMRARSLGQLAARG